MKIWTDRELQDEINQRAIDVDGQKMVSKAILEDIFIDPRFPMDKSEKMVDFLQFFHEMEESISK